VATSARLVAEGRGGKETLGSENKDLMPKRPVWMDKKILRKKRGRWGGERISEKISCTEKPEKFAGGHRGIVADMQNADRKT